MLFQTQQLGLLLLITFCRVFFPPSSHPVDEAVRSLSDPTDRTEAGSALAISHVCFASGLMLVILVQVTLLPFPAQGHCAAGRMCLHVVYNTISCNSSRNLRLFKSTLESSKSHRTTC